MAIGSAAEDRREHSDCALLLDREEEEEALSLSDMPVNLMEGEIKNKSCSEEIDEERGTNQGDFNFGPCCGGFNSTEPEMCAAEDIFFQGQILPLRLSVSSETRLCKFTQDASLIQAPSVSRSESMDHNSLGGFTSFSSRSSSSRSYYSSSSTGNSSIATPARRTNSKPRVPNQFHYALPSPKPQIRLSSASIGNVAGNRNRNSSVWDFFRLSLVRTPEIELHDLRARTSVSRNSSSGSSNSNSSSKNSNIKIIDSGSRNSSGNSKSIIRSSSTTNVRCGRSNIDPSCCSIKSGNSKTIDGKNAEKQRKQGFLDKGGGLLMSGCSCSVRATKPAPLDIVIMRTSNSNGNGNNEKGERGSVEEKMLGLKMRKRMVEKQQEKQGKQAMSRHRTFEWIKELSHASYLDHEEEKEA